ncbi:MAG: metal ABC transporter ATP-binding protein [Alphaproteobacteria bacterium CG_4_10_14_0_2_um_filter_63_37]|nr:MAG: hypothetical protein AUJ55_07670 [Proteobacteria bacterium CG1_02_64_396]PJA24450.1 MAG: metal ABC transporter ATP-binding protein [Alphaproteobacteria bacterium CG_4_10_14_0_2_um_filter_63_37]
MNEPILRIDDLSVHLGGQTILEGVDLALSRGEFLGIVGPNGGGKTTLIRAIAGLIPITSGAISIEGHNVTRRRPPKVQRRIGYVPQRLSIDPTFPARAIDVVAMGLRAMHPLRPWLSPQEKERAATCLDRVEMAPFAYTPFGALSGGQQQRVMIARALVNQPALLLLDEPETGMDLSGQERFYRLTASLAHEGVGIVMVGHDIGVISARVDQIACLRRRIHYHGHRGSPIPEAVMRDLYGDHIQIIAHDDRCIGCTHSHGAAP